MSSRGETRVGRITGEVGQFFASLDHAVFVADPDDGAFGQLLQARVDLKRFEIIGESLSRVGVRQYGELSHQGYLRAAFRSVRGLGGPFYGTPNGERVHEGNGEVGDLTGFQPRPRIGSLPGAIDFIMDLHANIKIGASRKPSERRRAKRLAPARLTPCKIRAADGGETPGWVHNLSVGGGGLLASHPVAPGAVLTVLFFNAAHTFALSTEFRVVRCYRVVNGDYYLGGQFTQPLRHDEILPFMM